MSVKKRILWLSGEIEQWVRDGVIEDDQAQAIMGRYPAPDSGLAWGRMTFAVTGSVLIGLGVILFFAFNWSGMHKFAKLGVIFTGLVACHGAALVVKRNAVRETLHVLGTMLFGSGIWLIAQIYHIEEHYPNGILAWAIGALALAWALPSLPQALLAAALLLVWNGFEALRFQAPMYHVPALIAASLLPLAFLLRSRVLTGAGLAAFVASLVFMLKYSFTLPLFVSLSAGLIAAGMVLERRETTSRTASVYLRFGWVLYYVLLFGLTFREASWGLREHVREWPHLTWYLSLTAIAAALWGAALYPWQDLKDRIKEDHAYDYLIPPVVMVLVLLSYFRVLQAWSFFPRLAYNLLFLASTVLLMMRGFRVGRPRLALYGCLLFAAYTLARYSDLFTSLLARSAMFLVMGAVMIGVGYFFARSRKSRTEARP